MTKNKIKIGSIISKAVDILFLVFYIVLVTVSLLDMLGVPIPFTDFSNENNNTLKFLIIVFSCVGIVVLNDKRDLAKNVAEPLARLNKVIAEQTKGSNVVSFKDKFDFYLYFTQALSTVENGAEIVVTSFEKDYNIKYDIGENKQIEALMEIWDNKIKSGSISVRQITHIFTKQDIVETEDRIKKFENAFNFSLSAFVGLPVTPFFDFIVIDHKLVLFGFSKDINAPHNLSFGFAINDINIAANMEKNFDMYWASTDCKILKSKDGVYKQNVEDLRSIAVNDRTIINHQDHNELMLQLIKDSISYRSVNKLISKMFFLTTENCFSIPKQMLNEKLDKLCEELQGKILSGFIAVKEADIQSTMTSFILGAEETINAISVEVEEETFWSSREGEAIFELNVKAISDKNIAVERVFIYNKERSPNIEETFARQRAAGVSVYPIITDKSHKGTYEDFIIIDNQAVFILTGKQGKYTIDSSIVKSYIEKYKRVKLQLV